LASACPMRLGELQSLRRRATMTVDVITKPAPTKNNSKAPCVSYVDQFGRVGHSIPIPRVITPSLPPADHVRVHAESTQLILEVTKVPVVHATLKVPRCCGL